MKKIIASNVDPLESGLLNLRIETTLAMVLDDISKLPDHKTEINLSGMLRELSTSEQTAVFNALTRFRALEQVDLRRNGPGVVQAIPLAFFEAPFFKTQSPADFAKGVCREILLDSDQMNAIFSRLDYTLRNDIYPCYFPDALRPGVLRGVIPRDGQSRWMVVIPNGRELNPGTGTLFVCAS